MTPCRQLLMWSVPSIAVILGIYWFRKKREYAKSDPGGREKIKSLKEELAEVLKAEAEALNESPLSKANRAVIKSAPIDIIPKNGGSQRSSPLELTEEEVDIEIERIISQKIVNIEPQSCNNPINKTKICEDMTEIKQSLTLSTKPFEILKTENNIHNMNSSVEQGKMSIIDNNESLITPEKLSNVSISSNKTQAHLESSTSTPNDESAELDDLVNEPSVSSVSHSNSFTASQHISERDSANHSPMDALLASPSMCHFSDNHSEGSSDSGKGCSEAASPPPANLNMTPIDPGVRIHQFVIPQNLVGLLIGKHGSFVTQIKSKTGASVFVRRHPDSIKLKICAVEGSQSEIEAGIEMIKEKFPEKRFPNFSTQEICAELYQRLLPLVPEFLQLQLVESVNNETIMTCLVSAGHFFLQQPLHPTFPSLHALHRLMAATYQSPEVPPLPRPVTEGSICAAPTENNWYRAQVISTSEENDTSVVKLVDFGGYLTVDNDQLKQIRSDFMTLPFQATEALLAFVKPSNDG